MTRRAVSGAWAGLLALPLLLIALWPEWVDYFLLWNDSIIYHHGYLVAGGSVFLLYLRRQSLLRLEPTGSWLALPLLIGAVAFLILSQAADVRVFRLLLAPIIIVLWGWTVWGFRFVRIAGGPVMLLVFAAPVWDDFSPLLQHITVFFNQIFLGIVDIPATIEEFFIILEVGTFLVENGCSGVRYLMVALFLGAFYGELYYPNYRRILLLVVIAGLLSMLANWIRVFGIIVAGHYTNMETSLVDDHEMFGWVVFVVVTLLPLYFIAGKLEGRQEQEKKLTHEMTGQTETAGKAGSVAWPAIASLLILAPLAVPWLLAPRIAATGEQWEVTLPDLSPEWRGPLTHADFWHPVYLNPDFEKSGVYVSDGLARIQLHITGYRTQGDNKELIAYDNQLFNRKQWTEVNRTTKPISDDVSKDLTRVNQITLASRNRADSHLLVWYWYQTGDQMLASAKRTKLTGGAIKLTGDNRGALWAIASPCDLPEDCSRKAADLETFLKALPL